MKSASLLYPYDSVLNLLEKILKRKGYFILSSNETEGTQKAIKKRPLNKSSILDIKVVKIDQHTTRVDLWINANENIYEKAVTDDDRLEEKLLNTLHKYF